MEKVELVEREVEHLDKWIIPRGEEKEGDLFSTVVSPGVTINLSFH